MKRIRLGFFRLDFSEMDRQIAKLRALRDSYRAANIGHYGEHLAALLND